jgi:hypothetical protein
MLEMIVGTGFLGYFLLTVFAAPATGLLVKDSLVAVRHVSVKAGEEEIFELAAEEFGLHEGFHVHRVTMHPIRIDVAMERNDGIRVRILPETQEDHFMIVIFAPSGVSSWTPVYEHLEPELKRKLGSTIEFTRLP